MELFSYHYVNIKTPWSNGVETLALILNSTTACMSSIRKTFGKKIDKHRASRYNFIATYILIHAVLVIGGVGI